MVKSLFLDDHEILVSNSYPTDRETESGIRFTGSKLAGIPDKLIIEGCQNGKDDCWNELAERYFVNPNDYRRKHPPRLFWFLYWKFYKYAVGSGKISYREAQINIEDITQETFLIVRKKIKLFDSNKPFFPWLCTIAKNVNYDYTRPKTTTVGREENRITIETKTYSLDTFYDESTTDGEHNIDNKSNSTHPFSDLGQQYIYACFNNKLFPQPVETKPGIKTSYFDRALSLKELYKEWYEAIVSLPPKYRDVMLLTAFAVTNEPDDNGRRKFIILFEKDGKEPKPLSYKEIGEILKISPGSVKSRLQEARKMLKKRHRNIFNKNNK